MKTNVKSSLDDAPTIENLLKLPKETLTKDNQRFIIYNGTPSEQIQLVELFGKELELDIMHYICEEGSRATMLRMVEIFGRDLPISVVNVCCGLFGNNEIRLKILEVFGKDLDPKSQSLYSRYNTHSEGIIKLLETLGQNLDVSAQIWCVKFGTKKEISLLLEIFGNKLHEATQRKFVASELWKMLMMIESIGSDLSPKMQRVCANRRPKSNCANFWETWHEQQEVHIALFKALGPKLVVEAQECYVNPVLAPLGIIAAMFKYVGKGIPHSLVQEIANKIEQLPSSQVLKETQAELFQYSDELEECHNCYEERRKRKEKQELERVQQREYALSLMHTPKAQSVRSKGLLPPLFGL